MKVSTCPHLRTSCFKLIFFFGFSTHEIYNTLIILLSIHAKTLVETIAIQNGMLKISLAHSA